MEQDFRYNQEAGWTAKLTAEHVPTQFVGELETYLTKGEKPVVRLKDDVVAKLRAKPEGTTLYRMSPEDTKYVCENTLEIMYLKGTRTTPDIKVLAAFNTKTGVLAVPVCDLRHLTADKLAVVEAQKKEAETNRQTKTALTNMAKTIQAEADKPYQVLCDIFSHMEEAIGLYNMLGAQRDALLVIRDEDVTWLRNTFKEVMINTAMQNNDDVVFSGILPNVQIRFMPDKSPSKMHKDLVGKVFDMGAYKIVIRAVSCGLPSPLENLSTKHLEWNVYHEDRLEGLMHPHIQTDGQENGWFKGAPCLGSYGEACKKAGTSGDLISMLKLLVDYLGSCSESGWYGSIMYWAEPAMYSTYCKCGAMKVNPEEPNAICSTCHTVIDGVDRVRWQHATTEGGTSDTAPTEAPRS